MPFTTANKNDGGEPISPREQKLNDLARRCADWLHGTLGGIGFALFVFEMGENGFLSYVSNANREDMRRSLAEHLRRTATFAEASATQMKEGEEVELRGRRFRVDAVRRTRVTLAPIDLGGWNGDDGVGR